MVSAGIAHHRAGRWAEAETLYAGALRLDPGHADVSFLRGTVLFQSGRLDDAITELGAALRGNPLNHAALNTLGMALQQRGRIDEAHPPLWRGPAPGARPSRRPQ